jgi:hypothetical protein
VISDVKYLIAPTRGELRNPIEERRIGLDHTPLT